MYKQGSRAAVVGVCLAFFALWHSIQRADAAAADAARHSRHGAGAAPPSAPSPSATAGALKTSGSGSAGPGTEGSPDAASAAAVRAALPPIAPPMTASQVIQVLDQTVDWYRTLGLQQQTANEPSDMLFFYDNRQTASKVMSLAFDIARANADLLSKEQPSSQDTGDTGISSQTLLQFKQKLESQSASVRAELDAQRRDLNAASTKSKIDVEA